MTQTIIVGGKEYGMRASALLPRLYRQKFSRDMITDLSNLQKNMNEAKDGKKQFDAVDLEVFENIAWLLIYHADPNQVPATPDEWLDGLDGVFDIYAALPQILSLWAGNMAQTSTPAKK